jgi:hypothetical protein
MRKMDFPHKKVHHYLLVYLKNKKFQRQITSELWDKEKLITFIQ